MSDAELIKHFEAGTLEPFHHADHVRVAFTYLCTCPLFEALERFSNGLKRFAAAKGKPQLYNETITHAYFFLIRERMARSVTADWNDFAGRNADLLAWKDGILTRYYQPDTLKSDLARTVFVFPDKGVCL